MSERHLRNLHQRFGTVSVLDLAMQQMQDTKAHDLGLFNRLPYVGIAYVPMVPALRHLLYACEGPDATFGGVEMKRLKILAVDQQHFTYAHWDDHHFDIPILKRDHSPYLLRGNVIELCPLT